LSKFVDWCSILKQKDEGEQTVLECMIVEFICKSTAGMNAE